MAVFGCFWLRVLDLAVGIRAVGLKAASRMSRAKLDIAVAAKNENISNFGYLLNEKWNSFHPAR